MPRYAFGPFLLDLEARALLRDGRPTTMAGKPLDTLIFLVQNRGRLLDKEELLANVWPGTIVEEANLSQSIFTIRKILGDSPKDRRYIATVPGRGYQFVAAVTEPELDPERVVATIPVPVAVGAVATTARFRKAVAVLSATAVATAVAFGVVRIASRRAIRGKPLCLSQLTPTSGCWRIRMFSAAIPFTRRSSSKSASRAGPSKAASAGSVRTTSSEPSLCLRLELGTSGGTCDEGPFSSWGTVTTHNGAFTRAAISPFRKRDAAMTPACRKMSN